MHWKGRRQSTNVEDRRGDRRRHDGGVGGGIGAVIITLIVLFLGGDPGSDHRQRTRHPGRSGPGRRRPRCAGQTTR